MPQPPIESYALIGDLHTAALVGRDGSIDWLCLPDLDSPSCFGSLLGGGNAGFWSLRPADSPDGTAQVVSRRYLDDTLVLETLWRTASGAVRVLDLMPIRDLNPDVVRIVEGVSGRVAMTGELVVRFDYGRIVPWVRYEQGRWSAVAGPDALWLDTSVPLVGDHSRTFASFDVEAGQRVSFSLTWAPSYGATPDPIEADRELDSTTTFWREWIGACQYQGPYASAVRRSLITLKALTYRPSGGIAAAATTSLPEQLGGPRNWDYRFCWLRDAALTVEALAGAGFTAEAGAWRNWLLRAAGGDPGELQIMYTLIGRRRLPEEELGHLSGYQDSRPVRVGNGAATQFQLDVYGQLLDGLHAARGAGLAPDSHSWDLQTVVAEHLARVWPQPDNSLWEVRGPRHHFVHSKVMAWVGMDRMIRTARRSGLPAPLDRWVATRDAIHDEVCRLGFDADRGTFTQFYGSNGVDAALLMLPRVGFLPPDDPRILGTIDAVRRELTDDGFLLRYRADADPQTGAKTVDGLPGAEGAFVACNFWLADALALTGRRREAVDLFERLLALRNDVGLMSEECDPRTGRHLGNTPQAFSHVGLVNTALTLSQPERSRAGKPDS